MKKKMKSRIAQCFLHINGVVLLSLVLTGCQAPGTKAPLKSATKSAPVAVDTREMERIELCQKRLGSLGKVDLAAYEKQQEYFNTLLANASSYAQVRDQLDTRTRKMVDALYEYKTESFCSDLEYELMKELRSKVEVSF